MKKNILIYPCGADNALELFYSLRYSVHLNVFGANSKDSIADLVWDKEIIYLSNITAENFWEEINQLIETYEIDMIFPTHDDVVYFFSKNLEKISIPIVGAEPLINEISRYKSKTYNFFKDEKFIPQQFHSIKDIKEYPVFIKPDKGQGSIGARKIYSDRDITEEVFINEVICEYLPGKEYTVDCFSDKNNELLYVFPRERYLIRNGVSHINKEANKDVVEKCKYIADKLNKKLKFKGLWFFQVKEDKNGALKLLEICPRIATTMAFDRYKGVNLPLLSVFVHLGMDVFTQIIHKNVELYRYSQTKPKYNCTYEHVYIDFDDTIIINNKVCIDAIAFIYQAKNEGKKVHLITKHEFNLKETLDRYHIPMEIFDQIIHIKMDELKFERMTNSSAIFIDNFYKERKEVFENLGIPVFDVEGIKGLLK